MRPRRCVSRANRVALPRAVPAVGGQEGAERVRRRTSGSESSGGCRCRCAGRPITYRGCRLLIADVDLRCGRVNNVQYRRAAILLCLCKEDQQHHIHELITWSEAPCGARHVSEAPCRSRHASETPCRARHVSEAPCRPRYVSEAPLQIRHAKLTACDSATLLVLFGNRPLTYIYVLEVLLQAQHMYCFE